ncbi:MAG: TIGR00282 family metallophosphoesterase [Armatimonadota bacterium]
MNILFIADIIGKPGRRIIKENLSKIKRREKIDFVIGNGENAAGGFGLTSKIKDELFEYGIDILTTGNHVWDNKEILAFIDKDERILRGANLPVKYGSPVYKTKINDKKVAVFSLIGRIFMGNYSISDCPFRKADRILEELSAGTDIIIVDMHAEATSEKKAMGFYLDGRATAVVGTHTHVSTADPVILPKGTAYITDAGMTGPIDSVIGVEKDIIINKFLTTMPSRFEVAKGPAQLEGVIIRINDATGKAESIERICIREES